MSQLQPMISRAPRLAASKKRAGKTVDDKACLPSGISSEAAVEKILGLLSTSEYFAARRLAQEAVGRFPEDAQVRKVANFFDRRGKATVRPGGPRQPNREKEFEWLRNPPDESHGKWVALLGGEVLAADENLEEVNRIVRSMNLAHPPLVHRVE